ncbi:MAG: NDP-sugar synthase [Candidatus Cloacimonetes bacterium]|nr:NDP-sugar synthase [Candidatus Cloacimonadota bacterium]
MKCLIYSPPEQTAWLKDFFPGVNPFNLKILNKPLLEYYIDFCVLTGIEQIRVVNTETGSDLEKYFNEGRQWGVDISYGFAKQEDNLLQVLKKNRRFCSKHDLLIIYGFQFIKYRKQCSEYDFMQSKEIIVSQQGNCSILHFPADSDLLSFDFSDIQQQNIQQPYILPINSIKSYYNLNMHILSEERDSYFLPGYNNEDGVYLGKNVIDKKSTSYTKPLVLGNNIQIQMNTDIGPNVVLGDNVIIDHSTKIENSIIYEYSYIGSELEIVNKIVFKKRLIDPDNEEVMQIVDSFLVSDIQSNLFHISLLRFLNGFIALIMITLTLIPFILLFPLCRITGMKTSKENYYRNKDSAICSCISFSQPGYSLIKRLFYRFSLDIFPLYFKVIGGELLLVGNFLIPRRTSTMKHLHLMPYYQPGVYSYPGSMLHNEEHENYVNDELEYCHTRSAWLDVKIVLQSWIVRLFSEWRLIKDYLGENNFDSN